MFVELHMIQNFAPSCLNRDDTNAPKDCDFGGYRRARISSQCLKRSIRRNTLFSETVGTDIGTRTKLLKRELIGKLETEGKEISKAGPIVDGFIQALVRKCKIDKDGRTNYLLYLSRAEIDSMASILSSHWDELVKNVPDETEEEGKKGKAKGKKKVTTEFDTLCQVITKEFISGNLSPDIALFGRFVADNNQFTDVAACQVAHAISTHKVNMDMDFFTAVDDLQPEEESGAGMMGTVEFNSACFYRYSVIDIGQLMTNMKDDKEITEKTVEGFIRSSVAAIPTGKQSSMAAHNPPSYIMVVIRKSGQPMSLANAFANPVWAGGYGKEGLIEKSITQLDKYIGQMVNLYGMAGIDEFRYSMTEETELETLKDLGKRYESLDQLIESTKGRIHECIDDSS